MRVFLNGQRSEPIHDKQKVSQLKWQQFLSLDSQSICHQIEPKRAILFFFTSFGFLHNILLFKYNNNVQRLPLHQSFLIDKPKMCKIWQKGIFQSCVRLLIGMQRAQYLQHFERLLEAFWSPIQFQITAPGLYWPLQSKCAQTTAPTQHAAADCDPTLFVITERALMEPQCQAFLVKFLKEWVGLNET